MTFKMPPILLLALTILGGAYGCSDLEAPTCSSAECSSSNFVVTQESTYAEVIEGSVPSDSDISSTDKKRWEVRFKSEDKTQLIIIRAYHQEDGLPLGANTYDLNCTRPEECAFCVTMLTDCDNNDFTAGVGCTAYYANSGSATVTATPSQGQGSFSGSLSGLQFRELTSGGSLRDDASTPDFCFANTVEFSAPMTNLCEDLFCDPPAEPTCTADTTSVQTSSEGVCNPQTGICDYELFDTPCEDGQACSGGACVDPSPACEESECSGVSECSGPFEVYTSGLCDDETGECTAYTTTDCTGEQHCKAGTCTSAYDGDFTTFSQLETLESLSCGELMEMPPSMGQDKSLTSGWYRSNNDEGDDTGYLKVVRWYTDNWLSHTNTYELSGSDSTNGGEFQLTFEVTSSGVGNMDHYLAVGGTVAVEQSDLCQAVSESQNTCAPFGGCTKQLVYTFINITFVAATMNMESGLDSDLTPNPDGTWLHFSGPNTLIAQGSNPDGYGPN